MMNNAPLTNIEKLINNEKIEMFVIDERDAREEKK